MAAIIKANTIAIAAIIQIAPIIWFAFRGVFPYIVQYRIGPTNGIKIVAPILLMFGILGSTPSSASLLNNFEIVCTSLIALFIFQETLEWSYFLGLSIMVIGTIIVVADTLAKENQ